MKKKLCSNVFFVILYVIFFVILLIPRYFRVTEGLPDYFIDDPAVGIFSMKYLLGDLDPGFYQYGPVYSYILAGIYYLYILFFNIDFSVFVENYFFNSYNYYLIARLSSTVVIIILAFLTAFVASKLYNKKVAVLALFLATFPFIDNLIEYHVKIDTLQAVWSLLTIFFVIKISKTGESKYYIISGFLIGLSFATKPLPALLILPTVFISHLLSVKNFNKVKGSIKAIFNKNLLKFSVISFFSVFIFNPYLLIHLSDFWEAHVRIMHRDTNLAYPHGWEFLPIFSENRFLGLVFVALLIFAIQYYVLSYIKTKKSSYLVILSYVFFFSLLFAFVPARTHFFIPIFPLLFIMISKLIIDISEKIKFKLLQYAFILLIFVLIIYNPAKTLYDRYDFIKRYPDPYQSVSTLAGKDWIEKNIPPMSKILMYDYFVYLPRLVDYRIENQMEFDEAFAHSQNRNKVYVDAYTKASEKYRNSGTVFYEIENYVIKKQNHGEESVVEEAELYEYCLENDFDYVITSDRRDLDIYPEFYERRFTRFNSYEYPLGKRFKIYKLK